jgi:hypothetical protein
MKLLKQNVSNWSDVAPFLDTICLPVYRYKMEQKELQLEEAHLITYITDELEKRLSGRMLLLPAFSLFSSDDKLLTHTLDHLNKELVDSGFHYSFVVIIEGNWRLENEDASFRVLNINKDATKEAELEQVYGQILSIWQSG